MSAVPGELDTAQQPPMAVPLRHFVVALGLLVLGALVGLGLATGTLFGWASLAHVHLLLAGWVCVTIMGAMTQFVPVWSGTALHSRRLAAVQLWLVVVGLLGFAAGLFTGRVAVLPVFGAAMLLGFWVFVYNVGRTLATLDSFDVTERHFAFALGCFLVVTTLGYLLTADLVHPVFVHLPVARIDVVHAHATLAVFGAVLATVLGALYQLGTMFTQTELHGIDIPFRRFEAVGYPVGVVTLATGRLVESHVVAVAGGLLVLASLLGFSIVLGRRLYEARVPWTPMLSRYAVVAPAMATWALLTVPAWLRDPLSAAALFGAPGVVHLLVFGVVGVVVLGTLYHVVPFVVWVHRYSDLLGYEPVPMIDDLYSDRVAAADLGCFLTGGALLVVADWFALPAVVAAVGGGAVLCGTLLFVWNLLTVIREYGPHSLAEVLLPSLAGDHSSPDGSAEEGSGAR